MADGSATDRSTELRSQGARRRNGDVQCGRWPRGRGYYSFDIGAWHLIALNSDCADLPTGDGCAEGTTQNDWLEADLAAHRNGCTLAYFHHPLLSTGGHGNTAAVRPFWQDLDAAGADVVLGGHSQHRERYLPVTAQQTPDAAGIREFVVGPAARTTSAPLDPPRRSARYGTSPRSASWS